MPASITINALAFAPASDVTIVSSVAGSLALPAKTQLLRGARYCQAPDPVCNQTGGPHRFSFERPRTKIIVVAAAFKESIGQIIRRDGAVQIKQRTFHA
ncbi:MAG: hypothetical protein IPP22_15070 [Nitrosomonas sp.]|nr:hypothetical protein [Nitrosomonas sp.]